MEPPLETAERTGLFERHGDVWFVEYAGISACVDDRIGLHYLAILLAHPHERFPAIELLFACRSERPAPRKPAGHRTRRAALSITERARFSVSHAIRTSLRRIAARHTSLALHLRATIHTGTFFSYDPGPGIHLAWRTGSTPDDGVPR
jgi:hypothetical protein